MWSLKYIDIHNIFAHVHTKYEFKQGVCTVIFGENRDDDDSDNNGAGKSTIFEGIAIALTGKSLRDIDKEVFINRNSEDCCVELYMSNAVLNSTLKVVRRLFRGSKSSKVEVYENEKINSQITSVNEANARITELLGVTREDLLRYFIISQDNRYQFFTAGDSEKKEVLNRITNADMVNPILEKLSAEKKSLGNSVQELQLEISKLSGKLDLYQAEKEEAEQSSEEDEVIQAKKKISQIQKEISESKEFIESLNKKLAKLRDTEDYKRKDEEPDTEELLSKKKKIRNAIKTLEDEKEEAETIVRKLNKELSGVITCPDCGSKFVLDSSLNLSVEEIKDLITETKKKITEYNSAIDVKRKRLDKVNSDIEKVDEIIAVIRKVKRNESAIMEDIETEKQNIKRANKRIASTEEYIQSIKTSSKRQETIDKCNARIAKTEAEIKSLEDKLKAVSEELSMVDYWIYYMGKNGFTTFLANRAVKIIEGITNSFLKRFHSSMTVEINGYKVNKNGDIREKIDVLAVYKGKYAQNFMGYSGGERSRVFLASILGIQHLINLSAKGRGLDLLCLDESLGALDSRGVVNICNILNQLGITILMITQNVSNDVNIANKVLIVREDEVSKIQSL